MIKITSITLFLACSIFAAAQSISAEAITTNAHFFQQSGIGSLQGTVGESISGNLENELILTQGFQQFYLTITPIFEPKQLDFNWNIYPNPTMDMIHFRMDLKGEFSLELLDLYGRIIETKQLGFGQASFSLIELPEALYLLRLKQKGQPFKSWKIQKYNR